MFRKLVLFYLRMRDCLPMMHPSRGFMFMRYSCRRVVRCSGAKAPLAAMAACDSPEHSSSAPPSPSSCAESEAAPTSEDEESKPSSEPEPPSEAATDVHSPTEEDSEASAESEPDDAEVSSNAESVAGLASEAADSTPAITEAELGKDTKARRPATSGSKATAAPATKKKMRKTDRVDKFEAHAFGALEEHIASRAFPAHVRTCGTCRVWKADGNGALSFQTSIPCHKNGKHGLGPRAAWPFAHTAPHTRDLENAPDSEKAWAVL